MLNKLNTQAFSALAMTIILFSLFSMFFIDLPLAEYLHQNLSLAIRSHAKHVAVLGYALYSLLPLGLLYIFFKLRGETQRARAVAFCWLAIAISGLICDGLKILFGRARPSDWFAHHHYGFYFLQIKSSRWSFPSGHSTTVAALLTSIWLVFNRYASVCLGLTLIVALSRLATNHHFLSDILIGCLLGFSTSLALYPKLKPTTHGL